MYSKYPKNILYENTGKDRDFNIFTEEFLGGADTFIYINGERCKDISAVQYSVREQKQPIYSYSSRRFNDVASGIRIVKGMLKIPVRNTNYNEKLNIETSSANLDGIQSKPPSWVYGYTPEKESNAILPQRVPEIYDIQSELKSAGYSVDLNGVLDSKTKIAIVKNQRDNKDILGLELNSTLNKYGKCIKKSNLKIMPNKTSPFIAEIKKDEVFCILNEINNYYLISFNELEGYILKEEVVIC